MYKRISTVRTFPTFTLPQRFVASLLGYLGVRSSLSDLRVKRALCLGGQYPPASLSKAVRLRRCRPMDGHKTVNDHADSRVRIIVAWYRARFGDSSAWLCSGNPLEKRSVSPRERRRLQFYTRCALWTSTATRRFIVVVVRRLSLGRVLSSTLDRARHRGFHRGFCSPTVLTCNIRECSRSIFR